MLDKFKQLGEMKRMRDQAVRIQKQLATEKIEFEESGVKVIISGDQKIQSLEIEGEDHNDLAQILNKALKKSQEVAARKVQEVSGGLSGLLGNQ